MFSCRRLHRFAFSVALATIALSAAADDGGDLAAIVDGLNASSHSDHSARSFTYWNEDGAVLENYAACHSQPCFLDFIGADGSEAGVVNAPAAIDAVVGCTSCQASAAHALDSAALPSGVTVSGLGGKSTFTVCHAGRASGDAIQAATTGVEDDAVSADVRFTDVHYGILAVAMQGDEAVMANRDASWTPRLLKAAFNQQVVAKDPGGDVHNPTDLLQRLQDSLQGLSEQVTVDMRARGRL